MVKRFAFDHVTTLVRDLDGANAALARVLGAAPAIESRIAGIEVGTFRIGGGELHVVTPRGPGPVADLVERGRDGLHHLALRVDDLDATLADLHDRGVRTLGAVVETLPGIREVFLDPATTGGLLIQAVERRGKGILE